MLLVEASLMTTREMAGLNWAVAVMVYGMPLIWRSQSDGPRSTTAQPNVNWA